MRFRRNRSPSPWFLHHTAVPSAQAKMNPTRSSAPLWLTLSGVALTTLGAFAQSPTPGIPNAGQRPSFGGGGQRFPNGRWGGPNAQGAQNPARAAVLNSLSPEDRQKIRAARMAAMSDPQVRAALANRQADPRAFRMAMRDAMVKSDPSLTPTFQKIQQAVQQARGDQLNKFQKRLGFLSDDERTALMKSRQAVQNDPAVASARQQRDSAATPEARQQAERIYQQAVQSAMIRNDGRVGPILDKIRQQRIAEPPKQAPAVVPTPAVTR